MELVIVCGFVVDVVVAAFWECFVVGCLMFGDSFAARTFELWIYVDDIRASMGWLLRDFDLAWFDCLCWLVASFMLFGMEVVGVASLGKRMWFVFMGLGGGTWLQLFGLLVDVGFGMVDVFGVLVDVTIVVDGVCFCWVVGKFFVFEVFDVYVEGDALFVVVVVVGARVFVE